MDVMPSMTHPVTTQTKMLEPMVNQESLPKIKKPTYKSIMAEFLKPLPKDDKPNIHLGGGQFTKLEKI